MVDTTPGSAGYSAGYRGEPRANPHPAGTVEFYDWEAGYAAGQSQALDDLWEKRVAFARGR
jgi:hypothetical protein